MDPSSELGRLVWYRLPNSGGEERYRAGFSIQPHESSHDLIVFLKQPEDIDFQLIGNFYFPEEVVEGTGVGQYI